MYNSEYIFKHVLKLLLLIYPFPTVLKTTSQGMCIVTQETFYKGNTLGILADFWQPKLSMSISLHSCVTVGT